VIEVNHKLELTSNEAVKQAVLAGLGISIMPLIGIHQELEAGKLSIIHQDGLPIRTEWQLVWLRKKELTPVMKAYLEFLATERDEISNHIISDSGNIQP
jgi:DNA-binding transcriptional LysR family regulator